DPAFQRNRVRAELLPLLADIGSRDPVPLLVRQADLFAEVDNTVSALAEGIDPTCAADLRAAARHVAGAALRAWLLAEGVGGGPPADGAAVDRILAGARNEVVACGVEGGWRVARTAGRLRLEPPSPSPSPFP